MSKQKAYTLVESILFIIIGILIACSIIQPSIVNIIIGIAVLILGIFSFTKSLSESSKSTLLVPGALWGTVLIGVSIAMLANNHDIFYIDVNEVVCDENGALQSDLTFDNIHLLGSKYNIWVDFLKQKGIWSQRYFVVKTTEKLYGL